jgi:peptidoglycan/xylan/chitin deacetylase (PgdA/CDA1 family)
MEWDEMLNPRYLLQELKTFYLQSLFGKRVHISTEKPIISITFDDVPRTAMINGVPILDNYNVKATFYVAMGLSHLYKNDTNSCKNDYDVYLSEKDIKELNRRGHHISCHTYSHYSLENGTARDMVRDAQRNARKLCELLDRSSIDHFSYPFGKVNLKVKRQLAKHYKTMRSSRPGCNRLGTDLYLLRANSIYDSTFDKKAIMHAINKIEHSGGWLIFYTHGVTHSPDEYSCTPKQFEWVIRQCMASKAQILTISDAYESIVSTYSN